MMNVKQSIKKIIPNKLYLMYYFKRKMGYVPNLKNPVTFNEKLNWLKLYDHNSVYTVMADKYLVKEFVSQKIGSQYVIPMLKVYESLDDICISDLPSQFVLKTTHDSGGVVICKDKERFDMDKAKKILKKHLERNYYYNWREWPYKNVTPRILAEVYMKDREFETLPVYKILCFSGEPKIIQTIQNDKQTNETIDYFDIQWNRLKLRQNFPNSVQPLEKPEQLEEMLMIASKLSKGMKFIRIDLYVINHRIFFSEYTFYSDAGLEKFYPSKWDKILGDWIKL